MYSILKFLYYADINQTLALAGGASLLLSAVLWYYYHRSKRVIKEIWAVDTYPARELRLMCSGGFDAVVEVEGNITCDHPLTSPVAKVSCCWYHTTIEYQVHQRQKCEWRTAFDEVRSTMFKVNDNTGFTLVDPSRADIDVEQVAERIAGYNEVSAIRSGLQISETGSYRLNEEVLLNGGYIYVLGQASCTQEGTSADVVIREPAEGYMDPGKKHFLISRKGEKELLSINGISTSVSFIMAAVALGIALFCGLGLIGIIPIDIQ